MGIHFLARYNFDFIPCSGHKFFVEPNHREPGRQQWCQLKQQRVTSQPCNKGWNARNSYDTNSTTCSYGTDGETVQALHFMDKSKIGIS